MANRFSKLDKMWFVAYVFVDVLAVITGILGVVTGVLIISYATEEKAYIILEGIIVILFSLIFAAFFWVIMKVILSSYSDIKFIRNKMYCESNEMFDAVLSRSDGIALSQNVDADKSVTETNDGNLAPQKYVKSLAEQLREIKQLCDEGILSQSEFEQAKKKLLGEYGEDK